MPTLPATAQIAPAALDCAAGFVPLDDRLPTYAELNGFDPGGAWDRLTPSQQRELGKLAVTFGTIGQCEGYFHATHEAAAEHHEGNWTPAMVDMAVWPQERIDDVARRGHDAFQALCDHFDPMWPVLFGWVAPRWAKPVIKRVA
ncbi:MAG: hypothetical protein JWQ94_550 [Tardiphaga sp.]|nr:hypothetical protein [Tardiphaga sp.]